jgi:hypothetical protein
MIGCTKEKRASNAFTLSGKWRSEKKDPAPLIDALKKELRGMPAHLVDGMVEKLKKGAEFTDEWEFNADGTGKFGRTGGELFPTTWRVVRRRGDSLFLELDVNPGTPGRSTVKVVFRGKNTILMSWLEDNGRASGEPPVVYHRVR